MALACAAPRLAEPPAPRLEPPPAGHRVDPGIVVTSIEPASGSFLGGRRVTVTGENFPADVTVTIGGVDVEAEVVGESVVVGTTGIHSPGRVDVVVRAPDGRTGVLAGAFRYTAQDPAEQRSAPAPAIARVEPIVGPESGGTAVTLVGEHFARGAVVTFNGVPAPAVTVRGPTTIEPWALAAPGTASARAWRCGPAASPGSA